MDCITESIRLRTECWVHNSMEVSSLHSPGHSAATTYQGHRLAVDSCARCSHQPPDADNRARQGHRPTMRNSVRCVQPMMGMLPAALVAATSHSMPTTALDTVTSHHFCFEGPRPKAELSLASTCCRLFAVDYAREGTSKVRKIIPNN